MAKGLGKGINALFSGLDVKSEDTIQEISVTDLRPNPYQPRKIFHPEAIQELKESILQHGILQPIIARKTIKGFEIVVGERRFRAAKEAGLSTVPVVMKEFSEKQMMELALLENLQREDLTPIEEAMAYQTLIEQLHMTQEQLAARLGKSRPHIANHLRLLTLPEEIQDWISHGKLTMGHGRALLSIKDKTLIVSIAEKVQKEKMSVRELEEFVSSLNQSVSRETKNKKPEKDVFIRQSEAVLRESLGTSVFIKQTKKKGKIEIEFFSKEDLDRLLELLRVSREEM
ncbi:ParB/RepB/Spo0J family partition protein [Priestia koreensis]|uniref:Chromosome partitioning protein ParB n=1 Tax=Priestia koreensis TaxID=284581 RepID=A0A0M0L4B5_9BACI|nr:ParB/RepB/Spo0J family partition protein [Priestia koreensis]KOO45925.1 chromosome partitioning protein ParB [Priestia koreensis]